MVKFSKSSKRLSSWSSHLSTQRCAFHDTWCFAGLVCFDKTPTAGKQHANHPLTENCSSPRKSTSLLLTCRSVIHGDIQTKKDQKGLATIIASCSALPDRLITAIRTNDFQKHMKRTSSPFCMLLTQLWEDICPHQVILEPCSRGFDPNKLQAVDVSGTDVSSSAHLKATFKVHQTNPTRSNHQWLCVCVKKTAIHIPYKFKFDYSLKTYHLWTEPHLVPCLIHVQLLFELISRAPIPFVRWQLRPGCHPGAQPGARDDPDGTEVFVFPTVSQKNPSHYTYYINLYQSISIYINLYQSISIYIKLYQSMSIYINLYQSISYKYHINIMLI